MKRFLLQEKDWGLELIAPIRIFFFFPGAAVVLFFTGKPGKYYIGK